MARGESVKPTLADVAARARVDRSVVSRVISEDPRLSIRDETRARVLRAIDELHYRPNAIARSLRTRRAEALGLVIPDFANPIYSLVMTGAESAALRHGIVLLMGSLAGGSAGGQSYLELLQAGRVDGLLIAVGDRADELVGGLAEADLPWLLVNRRVAGVERWVILDDERAASIAVDHLLALGHTRIAHIAGPESSDTGARRRAGFVQAMGSVGEPAIVAGDYTVEGGAEAMRSLLRRRPRPTAVVAANVAAAIGALHAAREAGLELPRDLSVVSIHDLPLAAYLNPPLTIVRMPLEEMGSRAVDLLVERAASDPIREVVAGDMVLVERGSTAPPAA